MYKLWPLYSRPASIPESRFQCAQPDLLQHAHEVKANSTRLTSFLRGPRSNNTLDSHIAYHITENGESSSPTLQSQCLNTEELPPFPWPLPRPLSCPRRGSLCVAPGAVAHYAVLGNDARLTLTVACCVLFEVFGGRKSLMGEETGNK